MSKTLSLDEQVEAIKKIVGSAGPLGSTVTPKFPANSVEILDEDLYDFDEPINADLLPPEFRSLVQD